MEPDEAIYLRYLAEERDADLEALLIRHREGLFLFLLSYVRNPEDAEDLMMDTFARLAIDRPPFDPRHPGSFKGWLYAIGRNNARMHLRKRRFLSVPLDEVLPSGDDLPDTSILKDEKNRALYRAMERLKPDYRRVLTLLYFDGLSHDEIALAMGLRIGQVYNLVKRGKAALRKALEGMGIDEARY